MINRQIIQPYIDAGYVSEKKHPSLDLWIYNYTPFTQYERKWDDVTMQCRGLILDGEGKVVARGFKKFFNLSEHDPADIPNEPFEVFEKMDGSLLIVFWNDGQWVTATRGSFDSEQAGHGMRILNEKGILGQLPKWPGITFLFEVIYPSNRIVVDYGAEETCVMLGAIEARCNHELSHDWMTFNMAPKGIPVVKRYDGLTDFDEIKRMIPNDREGFVVQFASGMRVKIKGDEYCRLHRILTQVSNKSIYECLRDNKPLDDLLERVPDEFYNFVRETIETFRRDYKAILDECRAVVAGHWGMSKKEFAESIFKHKYKDVIFDMVNVKDYQSAIWDHLKPVFQKPFQNRDRVD